MLCSESPWFLNGNDEEEGGKWNERGVSPSPSFCILAAGERLSAEDGDNAIDIDDAELGMDTGIELEVV